MIPRRGPPGAVSSSRLLAPVVYDRGQERLLDGELQAGERLPAEALKTEFGVSRQPVMEALRRLSSEGLAEIIPQAGYRVPSTAARTSATSSPSSAAWKKPPQASPPSGAPPRRPAN